MKKTLGLIASAAVLLMVPQTASAYLHCRGIISELAVYKDGTVLMSSGFGAIKVCNLATATTLPSPNNAAPISIDTCRAWYSSMLSAHLAGRELDIVVDDANYGTGCLNGLVLNGNLLKPLLHYRIFVE